MPFYVPYSRRAEDGTISIAVKKYNVLRRAMYFCRAVWRDRQRYSPGIAHKRGKTIKLYLPVWVGMRKYQLRPEELRRKREMNEVLPFDVSDAKVKWFAFAWWHTRIYDEGGEMRYLKYGEPIAPPVRKR